MVCTRRGVIAMPLILSGPWVAGPAASASGPGLAMLTYLPLPRHRALPQLARHVGAILRALPKQPGLVGYTLRAEPCAGRYWTLSLWEDEAALDAFVRSPAHRRAMTALRPWMAEPAFIRWRRDSQAPLPWDEAWLHWPGRAGAFPR